MNILIGGDLVPTTATLKAFCDGNTTELLGDELLQIWMSASVRIFNLEAPLIDHLSPICKWGPTLSVSTNAINGIKALKPTLIALANNHIMDQSRTGLQSTIKLLMDNEIAFVGVGDCNGKVKHSEILDVSGKRVGVYNCTEMEFSVATESSPGANPFDPFESLDQIAELKKRCDYVIVLYHGGKEQYRYPSPYLQKVCRKMVEKGADLVVCQHSHCVGYMETFAKGAIVYGQGNFIFNRINNEYWGSSIILNISSDQEIAIDYMPVKLTEQGIILASGEAAQEIISGFFNRSNQILEREFIDAKYQKYSLNNIRIYLVQFSGLHKWLARLNRFVFKDALLRLIYTRNDFFAMQNYMECEAHREIFITGLKSVNYAPR